MVAACSIARASISSSGAAPSQTARYPPKWLPTAIGASHRPAVPVLPPPPPDLALAMVEPVLIRLQLFRPAAGGERPQRRVEDHHRAGSPGRRGVLTSGPMPGASNAGPRKLTLQEDRPLQLTFLSAHLAEQVG